MTLERSAVLALDTKAISDEGEFEGYASTFGNADLGRDVVVKGAFVDTLKARPASKVKLLRQHDMSDPIGVVTALAEDDRGLHIKARLILDTVRGRETHALMKAGALDGLSIGFKTLADRFDRAKGLRFLSKLDLYEVSVVTLAMNPAASVTSVKAADHAEHARRVVAALNRARAALSR